jgi:hypothetical protein
MFRSKGRFQSALDFVLHKDVKRGKGGGGIVPYGSPEAKAIIERVKEVERKVASRYGRENNQK